MSGLLGVVLAPESGNTRRPSVSTFAEQRSNCFSVFGYIESNCSSCMLFFSYG